MKKVLFTAAIFASMMYTSCSSDDDSGKTCSYRLGEIENTVLEYLDDPSPANCEDYREALEDYIDSECERSEEFELALAGLGDCN